MMPLQKEYKYIQKINFKILYTTAQIIGIVIVYEIVFKNNLKVDFFIYSYNHMMIARNSIISKSSQLGNIISFCISWHSLSQLLQITQ